MRLVAQIKGGFYPAPPEAIAFATTFLHPPLDKQFTILDPCAGEGAALRQLGDLLGCPESARYAIELDDSRADTLRDAMLQSRVLAPASFFGCRASYNGFSFIWLNPPFDHSYGHYRVEDEFLRSATGWLMPGGIMALICPEEVADEHSDVRRHFTTYYENCRIVAFPEANRRFHEVIVFGQKRARPLQERSNTTVTWEWVQAPAGFVYPIPAGTGPKVFQKIEPTETELQRMLEQSPLRSHLRVPPKRTLPSPPLALRVGHIALLLASGHLDGVVVPPGKAPHVVRGTSRKREYIADISETINPDGTATTKTTISEKIELMVRTVDLSGNIRTFLEAGAEEG